ncbi:RING finger protein 32 [Cladochytrium tenue]|nr:RING finger protein 32 [Cladochytrium tenue]
MQRQVILACSHSYHWQCLVSYERHTGFKRCPLCRADYHEALKTSDAALAALSRAATAIQAAWRMHRLRRAYLGHRLRPGAPAPQHPALRRRLAADRLAALNDRLAAALRRDAECVAAVVAEIEGRARLDAYCTDPDWPAVLAALARRRGLTSGPTAWQQLDHDDACPICLGPLAIPPHTPPPSQDSNEPRVASPAVGWHAGLSPPPPPHKQPPRRLALLSCGHLFHATCIGAVERLGAAADDDDRYGDENAILTVDGGGAAATSTTSRFRRRRIRALRRPARACPVCRAPAYRRRSFAPAELARRLFVAATGGQVDALEDDDSDEDSDGFEGDDEENDHGDEAEGDAGGYHAEAPVVAAAADVGGGGGDGGGGGRGRNGRAAVTDNTSCGRTATVPPAASRRRRHPARAAHQPPPPPAPARAASHPNGRRPPPPSPPSSEEAHSLESTALLQLLGAPRNRNCHHRRRFPGSPVRPPPRLPRAGAAPSASRDATTAAAEDVAAHTPALPAARLPPLAPRRRAG